MEIANIISNSGYLCRNRMFFDSEVFIVMKNLFYKLGTLTMVKYNSESRVVQTEHNTIL